MTTAKTAMGANDSMKLIEQAAGVFHATGRRRSVINHLTGKMPKLESVAAGIKNQSKAEMPIVQAQDLGKGRGDEVTFHLVNPSGGYPIMGDNIAQGKGVGMKLSEGRLRVDQARFPIDMGSVMSQIRSPVDLRRLGRPMAQRKMDGYVDQAVLTHLAGARGFHNNFDWNVPTEDHPDFASIMVNKVKAPTKNRHFVAAGSTINQFSAAAGDMVIASTDVLKMDTVDAVRTFLEQVDLPPPPVQFDGDEAASDSPIRVMLLSPAQYSGFATDSNFRAFQASAMARAANAKGHPLFKGDAGLWNGILLVKMPKPIRFYAGDTVRYCNAYDTETETTCVVPASFGTTHAVDRAILLGGQALVQAWASSEHSGMPFFWSEEPGDHKNRLELLIGAVLGAAKTRFAVDLGEETQFTDHGVAVLDTAVKIIKPRG